MKRNNGKQFIFLRDAYFIRSETQTLLQGHYYYCYLLVFTQDSLFSFVELLSMRVLPSLQNIYKGAVISNFNHRSPHRGIELDFL